MKRLFPCLLLLPLLALCACSPYWYKLPETFTVQPSGLNYVQIYYQSAEDAPRIRCDLRNAQAIVRVGRSVTVGDDFNIEYEDRHFQDDRKIHYSMTPQFFTDALQALVDAGLFKEEKPNKDSPIYPKVLVKANVNHHVIDKFTFDEALIEEIRSQLFQYRMSDRM